MISQLEFLRRMNYDSTEDSICMNCCFLLVARGSEQTLEEAERTITANRQSGMSAHGVRSPNGELSKASP